MLLQGLDLTDIIGFSKHNQYIAVFYNKAGRRHKIKIFRRQFLYGMVVHILTPF